MEQSLCMNLEHGLQHGAPDRGRAEIDNRDPEPHRRIKRILVPTDFSSSAARALDQAAALARDWHATTTLLYVLDLNLHTPPTGPANGQQLKAELWQEGLTHLGQALVGLLGAGVEIETVIREGLPREEIVRAARNHDLIILGHRAKSFWQLFSRHTVKGVLETAPCPVLVVPEDREAPGDNL